MRVPPLQALSIDDLRRRSSTKWRTYGEDVLPLFVAETDFPLASALQRTLETAVALGDTGYTPPDPGLRDAFVGFAQRRFGWEVEPQRVRSTGDVVMGIVEILRATCAPGDRIVVTPPVYPPFYTCIPEAGAVVERVPLIDTGDRWKLDLPGIEASFAAGASGILLCNPHNPTGTVHRRDELERLAEIAGRYGAIVVSDEIHAPLVYGDVPFTPFLSSSAVAAEVGYAVTSASKAFNTAGLKCAVMVTAHDATTGIVDSMPSEVEWRTGLFGALTSVAALGGDSDEWLDSLLAALDANRKLLAELLAQHLPGARYRIPDAGYLAWVDLGPLGWGDNPAQRILAEARVALHFGPAFGEEGRGFVRINFGCSPEVLREAIERIGALVER